MTAPSTLEEDGHRPIDLRLGTFQPQVAGGPLPRFLGTLHTLLNAAPQRMTCVIVPLAQEVSHLLAFSAALARFRAHFGTLVAEYARTEFRPGECVRVLPSNLVYGFDGHFEARHGHFFRLQILGKRDYEARACPAEEILRLQRTDRPTPRGRATSDLGRIELTPLDRLLGVRTLGNASILRPEVLLQSGRPAFEAYIANIAVPGEARAPISLATALPWGVVCEDGSLRRHDGSDGSPICAVSSNSERLRLAATALPPEAVLVIIDGAHRVQNLEQLHSIAEHQRVLILASPSEHDQIEALRSAGVVVWQPDPADLFEEGEESAPAVGAPVLRAVRVSRELTLRAVPVSEDRLDQAARCLRDAERSIGEDTDPSAREMIGSCFGILLDLSEWYLSPQPGLVEDVRRRLRAISDRLRMVSHFIPAAVNQPITCAIEALESYVHQYQRSSTPKLAALAATLDELESSSEPYALLTRTDIATEQLSSYVPSRWPRATVARMRSVPTDPDLRAIVLGSWPRQSLLDELVGSCAAPDIRVVSYGYEQRWVAGYVRRREIARRSWRIEGPDRTRLLGLPASDRPAAPPQATPRSEAASLDELLAAVRMEGFRTRGRKGTPRGVAEAGEVVDAWYVGFAGQTYAYLTPTHRVPRVNAILRGQRSARGAVEQVVVEDLQAGDHVLFRNVGDSDVISLLAEQMYGSRYTAARKLAEEWRPVLRRIGSEASHIHRQLRRHGLSQQLSTVQRWLHDPSLIGPQNETDLRIIADVARDRWLQGHHAEVFEAIRNVRGWHMSAGTRLTDILLAELPDKLSMIGEGETRLELTLGDVWIAQVEEVSTAAEPRSYVEVNRLLWDLSHS
ncbi:MAG: DrmE family protein [Gemmatimonadaceae bacterium]